MSSTVYVGAKSKADINRRIAAGEAIPCRMYGVLLALDTMLDAFPAGTVVKVWSKRDYAGTPIAKAYGTWDGKRVR
jgi:hypothetical protein